MKRIQGSCAAMSHDAQIGLRKDAQVSMVSGSNEECIKNFCELNKLGVGIPIPEALRLQRGQVYRVFENLKQSSENQEKCNPKHFAFLIEEWLAFYVENHDMYTFAIEGYLLAKPYDVDELYKVKKAHSNLKPVFKQNPWEKRIWKKQLAFLNSLIEEREGEIESHRKGY